MNVILGKVIKVTRANVLIQVDDTVLVRPKGHPQNTFEHRPKVGDTLVRLTYVVGEYAYDHWLVVGKPQSTFTKL